MEQKNKESEWFGYQKVNPNSKTNMVLDVFDSVAPKYDLMNDLMSAGIHRAWKQKFIKLIRPRPNKKLLDVAGGTGDIAFKYLKECNNIADITVCDINANMLKHGKDRAVNKGILDSIEWIEGNAESLPFKDEQFDVYTISFGLRNVTNIDNALNDAYRVLKPGGKFFCLEFSEVKNPVFSKIYDLYSFKILPNIGKLIAKDKESYKYLAESIRQFPNQDDFKYRLEDAGFKNVKYHNLSNGIAAIHIGEK